MKKLLSLSPILLGLIVLTLTSCKVGEALGVSTATPTATPILASISEDEYLVYATVIPKMNWHDDAPALIRHKTCSYPEFEEDRSYAKEKLPNLQEETLADFAVQNKSTGSLQQSRFNFAHVIINTGDYLIPKKIGKEEHLLFSWELLRQDHPEGPLICVSRVAFNQAHTQAFLYASSGMDALGGQGYYVLLIYEKEMWRIDNVLFLWRS